MAGRDRFGHERMARSPGHGNVAIKSEISPSTVLAQLDHFIDAVTHGLVPSIHPGVSTPSVAQPAGLTDMAGHYARSGNPTALRLAVRQRDAWWDELLAFRTTAGGGAFGVQPDANIPAIDLAGFDREPDRASAQHRRRGIGGAGRPAAAVGRDRGGRRSDRRSRPGAAGSAGDVGRGDRIRTCDPLLPKQMRYQAAPLPDAAPLTRSDACGARG